ncbi:MAG: TonB-dependent receptor plug domain-containing protein, partial [Opitutaceae bacterium]
MQPFTNFAARLRRPFHRPALLFLVFAALSCPAAAQSAAAKRTFDVPAQGAERALELFSDQSGRAVIMNANPVQGFRTKSIKGEFTPLEALQLLLDGTGLVATQDDQSASLVILRQDASPDGPRAGAPATSDRPAQNDRKLAPTRPTVDKDDVLQLSPFEVTADNRGYQATTTMSGTRLNSKLEDLASAISVVTKEQMSDFALLDINDIFNYEAGTEGTGNYTELVFDTNGQPVDRTQLNPQGANRIRGVGPANTTFGNFETSGRVPIDPINIDAVEISRGPNSSIFGIGSVAGSVNSVPASANLSRDRSEIAVRADSTDGYRTSLDLNRVLKQGILAVRGSAVLQHHGFKLKPSGTDSVLLNGMVKFRPFKKTTLSGYYSHYRIEGNRPNVGMPRDGISGWQRAGRPTWDPPTVSGKLNGVTIANPAAYFHTVGQQFSQIYVDREGIADWTTGRTTSTTPANPNQTVGVRGARPDPTGFLEAQPLFQDYPVLFDQSIYDWTSVNLAAANRLRDKSATASVTLEQVFLESRRQTLALQLGWFREAAEQFARNSVGQPPGTANSVVVLQPDINERLQDGSPNPYFLRPFLGVTSPSYHDRPLDHDTYRLQLAYMLDLRSEKNRLRWLGKHQVSGYAEY